MPETLKAWDQTGLAEQWVPTSCSRDTTTTGPDRHWPPQPMTAMVTPAPMTRPQVVMDRLTTSPQATTPFQAERVLVSEERSTFPMARLSGMYRETCGNGSTTP